MTWNNAGIHKYENLSECLDSRLRGNDGKRHRQLPSMQHFGDDLAAAIRRTGNPVVVGLDPRWELLPASLAPAPTSDYQQRAQACEQFCCEIIDVVAPLVPAVKPQAAFFEECGPSGMVSLGKVMAHARQAGLLVVLDGKRNDIGSTAAAYARGSLGRDGHSAWGADALTVSPYLGADSLEPFIHVAEQRSAGLFVLVKTSNPGSHMLQDQQVARRQGRQPMRATARKALARSRWSLTVAQAAKIFNVSVAQGTIYQLVADYVEGESARTCGAQGYGIVGAVVGATYPTQLAELRAAMPHTWFLVPGFGSQGGSAADVAPAFDAQGLGAIINNSRGINFAHRRPEYQQKFGDARWQAAVEAATRDMISQLRADTPAGKLVP